MGEEEGDQVEGEHEAGKVEVVVRSEEGLRHVLLGVEVARRVKGQRGNRTSTVGVVVVGADAADGEEGPARRVASVGNAVRRGLEEVKAVLGAAVDGAGQDDEPLEEQASCEEDEGHGAQDRTFCRWLGNSAMLAGRGRSRGVVRTRYHGDEGGARSTGKRITRTKSGELETEWAWAQDAGSDACGRQHYIVGPAMGVELVWGRHVDPGVTYEPRQLRSFRQARQRD